MALATSVLIAEAQPDVLKIMSIYTKTGDKGATSLLTGERVSKDCINLQVVGALDELNAVLGMIVCELAVKADDFGRLLARIRTIQKDLFKAGSEIASSQLASELTDLKLIDKNKIESLEKEIDDMWADLPALKNFILPGGSAVSARLQLARAVCRRAERDLVGLSKQTKVREELFMYLNRLSDYLFTAGRWVNYKSGREEIIV